MVYLITGIAFLIGIIFGLVIGIVIDKYKENEFFYEYIDCKIKLYELEKQLKENVDSRASPQEEISDYCCED